MLLLISPAKKLDFEEPPLDIGQTAPALMENAATIAGMPPMAAMVNKEMVNAAYETFLGQGVLHERRLFQILTATEDKAEGMKAFIEKRDGQWKGR